ncbi:MAG TPA: serine/threonine-protein kinase [Polyangiaceae bacterium]
MLGSGGASQRLRERAARAAPDSCDTLEMSVDPDPPLRPGDAVDRYEIVRLIATGGMARVYEATHEWTHRSVALKIMHARYGCRSDLIERFRKEAMALSVIAHPNVVSVENGGLTRDGFVFLATEMLQGQSLREVLRERKRLPLADALELLIQVARGVGAAHAQNVIHRDLKPENIFCTTGGTVKVLDLGIAKWIGRDAKETDPKLGFVAGTPAYMAPEVLEARAVGVTADVYALGVIAYECLSGSHPLAPDGVWPAPAELARRALDYQPPPLPFVPLPLSQLIERAMHKNSARRPQSMRELAEALERLHAHSPRSVTRPAAPGAKRSPRRAVIGVVLALVTVLGLGAAAAPHYATGTGAGRATPALISRARDTASFVSAHTVWSFAAGQRRVPVSASSADGAGSKNLASATDLRPAVKPRVGRRAPSRLIARTFNAAADAPAKPAGVRSKEPRAR